MLGGVHGAAVTVEERFTTWCEEHSKEYSNLAQQEQRRQIFADNDITVHRLNEQYQQRYDVSPASKYAFMHTHTHIGKSSLN